MLSLRIPYKQEHTPLSVWTATDRAPSLSNAIAIYGGVLDGLHSGITRGSFIFIVNYKNNRNKNYHQIDFFLIEENENDVVLVRF